MKKYYVIMDTEECDYKIIYEEWSEIEEDIKGQRRFLAKGFKNYEEAEDYAMAWHVQSDNGTYLEKKKWYVINIHEGNGYELYHDVWSKVQQLTARKKNAYAASFDNETDARARIKYLKEKDQERIERAKSPIPYKTSLSDFGKKPENEKGEKN